MNPSRSVGRVPTLWLAVVFSALACALALAGTLLRPVWHDELYTLALARMPLPELFAALRLDSGPPVHYLICHALFMIVGWQEGSALGTFMVRLPSVVAFTLMPWVLWRWARGRGEVFFWTALLTIVWLPMLYFATEARVYALLALVNAVLWLLGPDLVRSGGVWVVFFTVLAAALPMLHYAGIVSFCFLPLLGLSIPRSRWRAFATALGAAALPLLMWSPVILGAPSGSMGWVDILSGPGRPGLATIEVVSPAGPYPALFEAPTSAVPPEASFLGLFLVVVGASVGSWRLASPRPGRSAEGSRIARVGLGVTPAVCLGTMATFGIPVYFAGRTESMIWLVVAGLIASLVTQAPRVWQLVAGGPYFLIGVFTIGGWMVELPERPASVGVEIGMRIAPELGSNDVIAVAGLWQLEVEHGLSMAILDGGELSVSRPDVQTLPRSQSGHPGWLDLKALSSPELLIEAGSLRDQALAGGGRVWLVWSPSLPLSQNVLPVFSGWQRLRAYESAVVLVDILVPSASRE